MHSTSPSSTASPAEETPMLSNGERKAFRGVTDYKKALNNEEGISTKMTYINFIRGMVGPGCFSIPLSLKFAGLGTGLTLLFAIGFIATLNMSKLVKSSQYLTVLSGGKALNYGNMVEKAFEQGPRSVRRWAPKAKFFVNSCLCLLQLGVCGVCYIFMTSHLKEVCDGLFDNAPSQTYLLIFMCLPFCLLVTIRSFKYLSYVSLAGNVLMITALVIIFQVRRDGWDMLNCALFGVSSKRQPRRTRCRTSPAGPASYWRPARFCMRMRGMLWCYL
ncbi:unnamed protein product, partial [Mesorhabditis spiculigera]